MKTRAELTLDVIKHENTTYLPSQLIFSSIKKKREVADALGFKTLDEMDREFGNHVILTVQLDDVPAYKGDETEKVKICEANGRCQVDWEAGRIIDCWGYEFEIDAPNGFNNLRTPLSGFTKEKLDKWSPPDLSTVDMDILFSIAEKDREVFQDDMLCIVSGYNGIFERAYNLIGFEEFMTLSVVEPDLIYALMEKITDYKVEAANEVVRRGFKVGHHGDDLGSQISTLFSVDAFRELILPHIKRLFRVYKDAGLPVQLHSCGVVTNFIPDLIDAGLDVLEPVQPVMDIEFLKREYGKDLTFYGGVDTQNLLPFCTPEEVREQTLRTIDILGKGGGYIVAPAQEIMPNVPVENIVAFVEAVKSVQ